MHNINIILLPVEAMRKIQELEQDLNNTKMTCRSTRYDLKNANNELAIGGLTISGLHRRRSEVNVSLYE